MQFKLLTWNVNGIRSLRDLKEIFDSLGADILCLQETKITRDTIDEKVALVKGYNSYFSFSKTKSGYSGVATYCRGDSVPILAEEGLSGILSNASDQIGCYGDIPTEFSPQELKHLDSEGRTVITQHRVEKPNGCQELVHIINVYCPRADPERSERLEFKLKFYRLLEMRAAALRQVGHVIIVGDINTSHREIDRCQQLPKDEFENNPGRKWLNHIILEINGSTPEARLDNNSFQLVDSYRYFHPSQTDAYTCWNTQIGARTTNYGSRIDYILVSQELLEDMADSIIMSDVMGSDHCPVMGHFRLKIISGTKLPSLCSKFYPEFSGTQSTLTSFLSRCQATSTSDELCQKKAKIDKGSKSTGQSNILTFFQKTAVMRESKTDDVKRTNIEVAETVKVKEKSTEAAAVAWRQVLKGPQAPPLCSGHNEPSVERVVKKNGPNQNRRFWVCARGEGRANDPNARCNFFKWK